MSQFSVFQFNFDGWRITPCRLFETSYIYNTFTAVPHSSLEMETVCYVWKQNTRHALAKGPSLARRDPSWDDNANGVARTFGPLCKAYR